MRIGEQIKNYRKTVGLTQEQVANYLGVSTPAVNKWEKRIRKEQILLRYSWRENCYRQLSMFKATCIS